MKVAFLYAGQGSQTPGMGRDLYEEFPTVRPIFDEPALPFDLKKVCFDGPGEVLSQTRYTQPCMVAFAAAVTRLFQEAGVTPDYTAGLSLGEYSALCCAGVFSPQTAVELAAFRAEAMERAAAGKASRMTALLGVIPQAAEEACRTARETTGLAVEVANLNCPGQVVIGGEEAAVLAAEELAKEKGAKRCLPLNVSGPFHTSLMAPAADSLRDKFRTMSFGEMEVPVVFNATARPLEEGLGQEVPELLVRQVQSPTLFEKSIRFLLEQGVDTVVEVGPGKVLSGFVKKIDPSVRLFPVQDAQGITETIRQLKGA